jgi:type III secretion protein U
MAKDDTEEKKFAPTQSRIRQLRRDGQVAKSQNFGEALVVLVLVIYLALAFDWVSGQLQLMLMLDPAQTGETFLDRATQTTGAIARTLGTILAPFFLIAVFVGILAAVVDMGGLPMSAKSLAPQFERLNPVEGFKRIFQMRSAIEIAKGLIKVLIIGAALTGVGLYTLNALMWSPTCGAECTLGAAKFTIGAALIIGAILLLIFGLADLPLSRFLFTHENRMTTTEYKRDNKDSSGDPTMRSARRSRGRELLEGGPVGESYANILIVGQGVAVGLKFEKGETPAPVVMVKKVGAEAEDLLMMGRGKGLSVIEDNELAQDLTLRSSTGENIPQALFDRVARAFIGAGIL